MTSPATPAGEGGLSGVESSRHAVQFYADDGTLCDAVSGYVGTGLAIGERVLVVATRDHWKVIAKRLVDHAFDVDRALASGSIDFLDAHETLAKISIGSAPDAALFERVVGEHVPRSGRTRAYGEIVDLLWKDGNLAAALRLEELWNQLLTERPLTLLCAYVVSDGASRDLAVFDAVHRAHTHVLAVEDPRASEEDRRTREIGMLQQRTRALEDEIARREQLEVALREALETREHLLHEVKDANRVKDDFLATMSHELRTPLNAILGWSSMLRTRPDVDTKKAIETIERNARSQVRLIEEILDISRIMTGKLRLELAPLDLAAVLRAALDAAAPAALAKGISLERRLEVDSCPSYGDAARLQQVFGNLLSNAIKFTAKSGRVTACLDRVGADVEISIEDNGRGIREDFLPHMFQRFRQADSSTTRTAGGLGIGLAIVGHLVELHGGVVKADSDGEGRGAKFTLTLPLRTGPTAENQSSITITSDDKLLSSLRVLICEDDPDSRDLLKEVLVSEGATVQLAATAGEAFDQFREFRPDVLVSDIGLPLVDGYSLIRQIRELGEQDGGRTPAIALTAYAGTEDARRAFSAGYQLHVAKPVDPDELAARVANLIGRPGRAVAGTR
jgi:signal transduction histidine kinase/ActR/RegA family two-component response regulator